MHFQIVYMYQSESHTVEMDYGRIKVYVYYLFNYIFYFYWFQLDILRYFTMGDCPWSLCLFLGQTTLRCRKYTLLTTRSVRPQFLRDGRLRRWQIDDPTVSEKTAFIDIWRVFICIVWKYMDRHHFSVPSGQSYQLLADGSIDFVSVSARRESSKSLVLTNSRTLNV